MADESGRVLALESHLADVKRSLVAHDFLLRGILTHLALNEPAALEGLVAGLEKSGLYGTQMASDEITTEVAADLTALLGEVAAAVKAKR